jgi:hypothetical protein
MGFGAWRVCVCGRGGRGVWVTSSSPAVPRVPVHPCTLVPPLYWWGHVRVVSHVLCSCRNVLASLPHTPLHPLTRHPAPSKDPRRLALIGVLFGGRKGGSSLSTAGLCHVIVGSACRDGCMPTGVDPIPLCVCMC